MEPVVIGTEGMEVPEEGDGEREDDEGGEEGGDASVEEEPEGGEEEEAEQGEENAPSEFEGTGGWDANGFKASGNGTEGPNGKLGPMDGTSEGCVVHAGESDAEVGRFAEVAGIGKPGVGVGVDKETRSPPGSGRGEVGHVGCGPPFEEADGMVEENGHAREPCGEQKEGDKTDKACHGG